MRPVPGAGGCCGRGKGDPCAGGWASGAPRVPDSSSFLSNFLIILDGFPAPRPTATVPGAAAGERKTLQEGRPRVLTPVGPAGRHSGPRPAPLGRPWPPSPPRDAGTPSAPPTVARGRGQGQTLPAGLPRPSSQVLQLGSEAASVELYLVSW